MTVRSLDDARARRLLEQIPTELTPPEDAGDKLVTVVAALGLIMLLVASQSQDETTKSVLVEFGTAFLTFLVIDLWFLGVFGRVTDKVTGRAQRPIA